MRCVPSPLSLLLTNLRGRNLRTRPNRRAASVVVHRLAVPMTISTGLTRTRSLGGGYVALFISFFSADFSFQCDPCGKVQGKCRPFRGAPTYAPCQQCVRRRQTCDKVSLRYYRSLASNAKRIYDLKAERGTPPKRAMQIGVEVPSPPPARPVRARRTRRAPSPPPVAGPSRLTPSPAAAAPPADDPLHHFRDYENLLTQITRGEALTTWVPHHCVEMRLASAEISPRTRSKLAPPPEREEPPRDKGKGRAELQDEDDPPAETSDEDEDEDEDAEGGFETWGGI